MTTINSLLKIRRSTVDPSATATFGKRGDLLMREANGAVALYQKQDNGASVNWLLVGGAGGTGLPVFVASDPIGPAAGDQWLRFDPGTNPTSIAGVINTGALVPAIDINIPTPTLADVLWMAGQATSFPAPGTPATLLMQGGLAESLVTITGGWRIIYNAGVSTYNSIITLINTQSMADIGKNIATLNGATPGGDIYSPEFASQVLNDAVAPKTQLKLFQGGYYNITSLTSYSVANP